MEVEGALVWAWVFCSTSLAAFVLRPYRSADVLKEVLGSIFSQVQYTLISSQHMSAMRVRSNNFVLRI